MKSCSIGRASKQLSRLVDEVSSEHEPVLITGGRANVVLVGEAEWNALQETLSLICIAGMRESILEGMRAPLDELSADLDW